jgi:hypothetical protein
MSDVHYFAGLDLGPPGEFTALAVLEQTNCGNPDRPESTLKHYAVRHLARFPPGTPFTDVAAEVNQLFAEPPLAGSTLAVDVTGVGKAVMALFTKAGIRAQFQTVFITAGQHAVEGCDVSIPKVELAGTLQVLLQTRRLKVASSLPDASTLAHELSDFRIKPRLADASLEEWRVGAKDDLVFAVAIAARASERVVRLAVWC